MNTDEFVHRINRLIEIHMEGFEEKHGFPPGDNKILPADPASGADSALVQEFGDGVVPDDMLAFFGRIERVSLPDFWNAYFLGPASWVVSIHRAESPRQIQLPDGPAEVVMVGSDGGGTMYGLVPSEANGVYGLPQDRIKDGVYVPTHRGIYAPEQLRKIAIDFSDFLSRLVTGLEEYVADGSAGPFDF